MGVHCFLVAFDIRNLTISRVLESLRVGKRLPEARFANLKVAAKGQQSVYERYAESAAQNTQATHGRGV